MDKLSLYLRESYDELMHKVTWPSWAMLVDAAKIVLVSTVIITAIIFLMDVVSNYILQIVYGL
ncbi:MAG: preprotein translocase subunit SecE [Saprospiraceae bacterium]|jgi:preprotein translocase subunit SecE|nr:preprotein translocase subunit SecE [Saprospiraceae bacterium]MBK6477187.1 preprotein translocase subunit SecE [Saprospiraceae bacterium]MBK6814512.1 preprotein translocase subunit SecE [Saprospiraceae bacterium]MBK7369899.1 preprotein translocase subunit SecE [Saprospiraceae bacterium]MBK7437602.1 preprotein translocase subunit SecE [Saprospiraceae bacterium]